MPSCVLRVSGTNYDPLPELEKTHLVPEPYKVWRKGDKSLRRSGAKRRLYDYGGFSCQAANTKSEKLGKQIKKVVKFLKENEANLMKISENDSIEHKTIDFQVNLRLGKTIWGQFDRFPPELLYMAGKLGIGIEISLYKS